MASMAMLNNQRVNNGDLTMNNGSYPWKTWGFHPQTGGDLAINNGDLRHHGIHGMPQFIYPSFFWARYHPMAILKMISEHPYDFWRES
jgi:hypothetical protein